MKSNVLFLFLALISAPLFAGTYSGGLGTSGAPYQIATLNDLQELSTTSADWAVDIYFIQTANIDAIATSTWNDGAGMAPIGNATTKFYGSYDGQGFTISELTINRPGIANIGMFGYAQLA